MSVSRSVLWSFVGQIGMLLASLVSTVILGRWLTPVDFGAFAFAVTIYSMVQWLLQTGMGTYVIREQDRSKTKLETAYAVTTIEGVAATVIIMALSPIAGWFGNYSAIGWVTFAAAFMPLCCAPEGLLDGLWLRDGLYARYACLQVMKSAMQTIVAIGTQYFFHWGVFSLVAGLLTYGLTAAAFGLGALSFQYKVRPKRWPEHWAELRSFGGRNLMLVLGQTGSTRIPDLLIGRMLSVYMLGHYNRASNALDMISRTSVTSMVRALVPSFFRKVGQGSPLDAEVASLLNGLLFVAWPALIGVAVLSEPIIRLIYGPQWGIAGMILPWLCLCYAIDTARSGAMEALMARDRITLNARIEFIHAIYAIGLIYFASHYGLKAILYAKVLDSLTTLIVYFAAMHRLGALPTGRLPAIYGTNTLLALAAGAPAALWMHLWGWPDQLEFRQYMLAIGSSVALWLVVCAAVGHPYFRKAVEIGMRRLRPASA